MKMILLLSSLFFCFHSLANCSEGLQAFTTTIHPLLMQRCANCHGDDGMVVEHSQSDPSKAYILSKKFVNFENLYSSTFIRKVRTSHWVNIDPDEIGMSVEEMEAGLKKWWELGESLCPPSLTFISSPIQIPVDLPTRDSGMFSSIQWDLSMRNSDLKDCEFMVQIQSFTNESGSVPGSYRLKNPSIMCRSGRMKLERVRFMLNGTTNSFENIFEDVIADFIHDGTPKTLSGEQMIIIDQLGGLKGLTVGFGLIKRDLK